MSLRLRLAVDHFVQKIPRPKCISSPLTLVHRHRLVHPWHVEQIAPAQILFPHTPSIWPQADLVSEHLIEIPRLGPQPSLYKFVRFKTACELLAVSDALTKTTLASPSFA